MLALGLASGIGGAIGKMISYAVTDRLLAGNPQFKDSRLHRVVEGNATRRPRLTGLVVFLCVALPLPDDTVVIPLAMIHYGLRRLIAPICAGKIAHNVAVAMLFAGSTTWTARHLRGDVKVDLTFCLLVAFVLLICYQVERARADRAASLALLAVPAIGSDGAIATVSSGAPGR